VTSIIHAAVKVSAMWKFRIAVIDSNGNCAILPFDPGSIVKMNKARRHNRMFPCGHIELPETNTIPLKSFPRTALQDRHKGCLCRSMNVDQFVVVGEDRMQWTRVDLLNECCEPSRRERSEIIDISADADWIAVANKDSQIVVYSTRTLLSSAFTIPTFSSSISCTAVNDGFHAMVFGTRDGSLFFCSMNSGSVTRKVSLDGCRPLQILITPFWGFVLVYGTKITDGRLKHFILLYSINGDLIRSMPCEKQVAAWSAFTSVDGFDHVAMIDVTGTCFLFEAFYLDLRMQFTVPYSKVVLLSVLVQESAVLVVTEDGTIIIAPLS
jgi:hypothetical protein